jgi:hypothetical protein
MTMTKEEIEELGRLEHEASRAKWQKLRPAIA